MPRYGIGDVRRALRARGDDLRSYPNVVRVGIGEQVTGGRGRGRLAVRVIVSRKLREPEVPLPSRIRGVEPDGSPARYYIPIDVERGPRKLRALQLRGGDRIRRVKRGAVGIVYHTSGGRRVLLTNAHVVAQLNQRSIGRPVKRGAVVIGSVHRTVRIRATGVNRVDVAAVELAPGIEAQPLALLGETQPVVRTGRILAGDGHPYFVVDHHGNRKTFHRPLLVTEPQAVAIGSNDVFFADFFTMSAVGGARAVPGDSGSLVVREHPEGAVACGLLFAGAGSTMALFPIERVLGQLGGSEASPTGTSEAMEIPFS